MSSIAVSSSRAVCSFSSFWLNNPRLLSGHVERSLCKLQDGEREQYVYWEKHMSMQIKYCTDFMSAPYMMRCGATHIVFTIFAMLAYIRDFSGK